LEDQYLDWRVGLMFLPLNRLPEDGTARVSFTLTGYNAIDRWINALEYRELSHSRVGYYAISATSMKIQVGVKSHFF
jgi:hypothetical protein